MSNRYLEKAAAMFPSIPYQKNLNEEDKKKYLSNYQHASTGSVANVGRTALTAVIGGTGAVAGMGAGGHYGKRLAQHVANNAKDKMIMNGERDLGKILSKGMSVHRKIRLPATIAGGILGGIPAAMYSDKWRHDYAKKKTEGNKG